MNDLPSINHDLPPCAIAPHLHALPPEPIIPTHNVPPLHLVASHRAGGARSRGLLFRTKEFVDSILILTLTIGHVQDRANEGS